MQKINKQQFVTREDLEEVLDKKLDEKLENYPTRSEMEFTFDKFERKIDDKSRQYRDQILTKMDSIVGGLQDMREERIISDHHVKELQGTTKSHEKRLRELERKN